MYKYYWNITDFQNLAKYCKQNKKKVKKKKDFVVSVKFLISKLYIINKFNLYEILFKKWHIFL